MWQTFETAPKDGSVFIAWDSQGYSNVECTCFVTFWDADEEGNVEQFVLVSNAIGEASDDVNFTHWMPLPTAPVSA